MELEREPLGEMQALRLLAGAPIGRVVYTVDALPAVLPVRFRVDGEGCVVMRTRAKSELARAVEGALIAFEAGEIDDSDGSGWTVTVLGWADVEDREAKAVVPAAMETLGSEVLIRLRPELVLGQRLVVAAEGPTT